MNNLDLNAMGVSEMSTQELKVVEGGLWWIVGVLVSGLIYDIVSNPTASNHAAKAGFKSAY